MLSAHARRAWMLGIGMLAFVAIGCTSPDATVAAGNSGGTTSVLDEDWLASSSTMTTTAVAEMPITTTLPAAPTTSNPASEPPPMAPVTTPRTVSSCQPAVASLAATYGDVELARFEISTRAELEDALARWGNATIDRPAPTGDPAEQAATCIIHGDNLGPTHGPPPQDAENRPKYYTAIKVVIFENGVSRAVTFGQRDNTTGVVNLLPSDS